MAIVETAETLFAQQGIDAVSLRQIGSAIGSSNTSVVAYHFGNKESLLEAIFHYRLPDIEARRQSLFQQAVEAGQDSDPLQLMRALWLPLFEQTNDEGEHSYAGFMSTLMYSSLGGVRLALNSDYPTAIAISERLKALMTPAQRQLFDSRVLMNTVMITGALKMIDQSDLSVDGSQMFEDTLQMASAALFAPTGE